MINYFANNLWQMWAIICVFCLIIELSTGGFFIICFAVGGVVSGVASLLGVDFFWQVVVFAVSSLLCIFTVRPFALKYFRNHQGPDRVSNADALMGRIGTVSQTIEAGGYGRVAIDGDDWKAESENGKEIETGARVKVVARESIIITVSEVQ